MHQFGTIIHFLRGTPFINAPHPPPESVFAHPRGSAKFDMTTGQLVALTRGGRALILVDTNVLVDLVTDTRFGANGRNGSWIVLIASN